MSNMHNKDLGKQGEDAVANLYRQNGFKILARNFTNKRGKSFGEIDFIALKNNHLHFVEIKTRANRTSWFGDAVEAVTRVKKQRLIKAAKFFIMLFKEFASCHVHFDVATVEFSPFDKSPQKIKIYSDCIDTD